VFSRFCHFPTLRLIASDAVPSRSSQYICGFLREKGEWEEREIRVPSSGMGIKGEIRGGKIEEKEKEGKTLNLMPFKTRFSAVLQPLETANRRRPRRNRIDCNQDVNFSRSSARQPPPSADQKY